jgi:hypothetical protein
LMNLMLLFLTPIKTLRMQYFQSRYQDKENSQFTLINGG